MAGISSDLYSILRQLEGIAENNLEKMGDIIFLSMAREDKKNVVASLYPFGEPLEKVYKDQDSFRELVLPSNIPPVGEIGSQCDDSPPRWKEVQEVVRSARTSSALGPNGVRMHQIC